MLQAPSSIPIAFKQRSKHNDIQNKTVIKIMAEMITLIHTENSGLFESDGSLTTNVTKAAQPARHRQTVVKTAKNLKVLVSRLFVLCSLSGMFLETTMRVLSCLRASGANFPSAISMKTQLLLHVKHEEMTGHNVETSLMPDRIKLCFFEGFANVLMVQMRAKNQLPIPNNPYGNP
ncbi:6249_t:CDS:1 [Paraglomus brasilianum]|uniref:6249_t:CDS:1 n=1 Tax=Paraglomus brasilianum TaxID=144538 RepID=A0A9N9C752_9GLOM|nr:6249_t:CDS:1 [Paraglomus brasilianum]